ncbi:MAG: ADP-ribose-binding protein [Candidatus Lokiarchaeota archaeon]|nr:ADP-ribose-binding protein [Candidatus Lokiarchaeota archaeon]
MNTIVINDTTIEILVNKIIESTSDAIVIPTNSRLLPSGVVRCEVLKSAGAQVQLECNRIINKIGVISTGSAVITSAGELKSKHIIHVLGPNMGQGKEGKKLMLATWNSLRLADKRNLESIAFSPISMDHVGFSPKISAEFMLPTIKKYITEKPRTSLKKVELYLPNLPEYKEFERVLDKMKEN